MGRVIWKQDSAQAKTPFYAVLSEINIWNLEELKYYLQKYFYLIDEQFFSDSLIHFLVDEMNRPDLGRMVSMSRGKSAPVMVASKLLLSIDEEPESVEKEWRNKASDYIRMPEKNKLLLKADTLYSLNKIAKAEECYKEILEKQSKHVINMSNEESGKVCYRLAFISLESLSWKAAGSYLQEAYGLLGYEAILKELYILSCMSQEVLCDGSLFHDVSPRTLRDWQQEYESKKEMTQAEFPLSRYEQLSDCAYDETQKDFAVDLLEKWRVEYRKIRRNSCQETDFSV